MVKQKKYLRTLTALLFAVILGCTGILSTMTVKAASTIPTDLVTTYYEMYGYRITVVQWDSVSKATGYQLYRANSEDGAYTLVYEGKGRSFAEDHEMNDNLGLGATDDIHFYKVAATVDGVEREKSEATCNRPELVQTVSSPQSGPSVRANMILNAKPSQRADIVITWEYDGQADYYEVYRSETEDGEYESIVTDLTDLSYRNSGLGDRVTYYYKVGVVLDDIITTFGPVSATTHGDLEAPTNLTVTATGTSTIRISWDAAIGADFYEVYRSTEEDGVYTVVGDETMETSIVDTGLSTDTTYYYKVRAVQECETCSFVGPVGATTWKGLGDPSDIRATATGTATIDVAWDAADNAVSYLLYRSTTEDGIYDPIGGTITGTTYSDSGLTAGTTYYYKVRSVGQSGTSDYIGPADATTWKELGDPSNITATATGTSTITVNWTAGTNAESYLLYRSLTEDGTYEPMGGPITGTAYNDSGLTPDTTYYYKVRSVGQNATSDYIGPADATTWKGLGDPSNITATATGTSTIAVSWHAATNAESYLLYRSTTEDGIYDPIGGTLTGTTYNDSGLTSDTTYYYKVRSVGQNATSDYIGPADATTWKDLGDPSNITATATGISTITVSWNAGSNAESYLLYRSTTENGIYDPIGGALIGTTYNDSGLTPDTTYYYKVRSVEQNTTGDYVGPANATTWKALGDPSNITANATGTSSITVSWNAGANADSYVLYRSTTEDGTYDPIGGTIIGTTYYDSGLTADTTYYYKVQAISLNQTGVLVGPANATTWKILGEPSSIRATATGTSTITVNWNAGTNAESYILHRSTSENGIYNPIGGTIVGTTYHDSGLTPDTTYYYKVQSVGQNQTGDLIGPANATTWKKLGDPSSITATATGESTITVNWTIASNAESYELYRSTSANGTYTQIGGIITGTIYYDTGLKANTTYYYKVRAIGHGQIGNYVGPASAKTFTVWNISLHCCRTNQMHIAWDREPGAAYYKVYMKQTSYSNPWQLRAAKVTTNHFYDTGGGFIQQNCHWFKIEAYDSSGNLLRASNGEANANFYYSIPDIVRCYCYTWHNIR